ncbi:hypothetical protein M0802_008103 [Mischocyttarus mexicanus]|nr:hypothetical protein M0802_008103 [Mischocyttarus mexicanus]
MMMMVLKQHLQKPPGIALEIVLSKRLHVFHQFNTRFNMLELSKPFVPKLTNSEKGVGNSKPVFSASPRATSLDK